MISHAGKVQNAMNQITNVSASKIQPAILSTERFSLDGSYEEVSQQYQTRKSVHI